MRGALRSFGLLALYVGAQVVALLLALPFKSAGLSSTANPNSPTNPLLIIAIIVIAPLGILWLARRSGGVAALRLLILLGIAGSLDYTLYATFALFTPPPVYLSPPGFALVADAALPLAGIVATSLFLALLMEPQWYIVDLAGFLAAGSLIALLGISFGILPSFILLGALLIYDAIAVYRTKHMISLADVVTEMKLPILMVMPTSGGYDYTRSGSFSAAKGRPAEEREVMFMGLGDVVIPGVLVVSAFVSLPATMTVLGVGGNLLVAIGVLLGSLAGYAVLMGRVARGGAQAGLPFLNGGAMAGYLVAYLLVFHDPSFGFALAF